MASGGLPGGAVVHLQNRAKHGPGRALGAWECVDKALPASAMLSDALTAYAKQSGWGSLQAVLQEAQNGDVRRLELLGLAPLAKRLCLAFLYSMDYGTVGLRANRGTAQLFTGARRFWSAWQALYDAKLASQLGQARPQRAPAVPAPTALPAREPRAKASPAKRTRRTHQGARSSPVCDICKKPMLGHPRVGYWPVH
jgi:hypothetical protein